MEAGSKAHCIMLPSQKGGFISRQVESHGNEIPCESNGGDAIATGCNGVALSLSTVCGFQMLALTPKTSSLLLSNDEQAPEAATACGKRFRDKYETPSPSSTYMGRPTTMPAPPPLRPSQKEEDFTNIFAIESFLHRFPVLGEAEDSEVRQNRGDLVGIQPRHGDLAFARRLKMKKTQGRARSPRGVGDDVGDGPGLNL